MMETLVETGPDIGKPYHHHPLYPSVLSPSRKRRHKAAGGLQHYYQYHLDHDSYISDASPRRDKAAMSGPPLDPMYNTPSFSAEEQFQHSQNSKAAPFLQSTISPGDVTPLGLTHTMLNQIPKQANMRFSIHGQTAPRAADLHAGLPGGLRWPQQRAIANKRRRTPQQAQRLEDVFNQKPNPSEAEKKQLSEELKMDLKQVQTWFQNKRQRVKTQENAKGVQELTQENQQLQDQMRELQHDLARIHERNRSLKQQLAVRKQKMDELREAAQDLLDEYYAVVHRSEHEDDRQNNEDSEREHMQRSMSNVSVPPPSLDTFEAATRAANLVDTTAQDRDHQRTRVTSSVLPEASVGAYSTRDEGASNFPSFSQAADEDKPIMTAGDSINLPRSTKRDPSLDIEISEQPSMSVPNRPKSENPHLADTVSNLLRNNSENYDKSTAHAEYRNEQDGNDE